MHIDIWSDIACPFCYLGKATLAAALADFRPTTDSGERADWAAGDVAIRFRSFQLNPEAPIELPEGDVYDYLSTKYGISREQAIAQNQQIAARASEYGIQMNMDDIVMTNTGSAHRLLHLAREYGKQDELVVRLFKAYFTDGLNVASSSVLIQLATDTGLPADQVAQVVESNAFENEVQHDLQLARQYGITGVPFFVINDKYAISGAQPESVFLEALQTAWSDSA